MVTHTCEEDLHESCPSHAHHIQHENDHNDHNRNHFWPHDTHNNHIRWTTNGHHKVFTACEGDDCKLWRSHHQCLCVGEQEGWNLYVNQSIDKYHVWNIVHEATVTSLSPSRNELSSHASSLHLQYHFHIWSKLMKAENSTFLLRWRLLSSIGLCINVCRRIGEKVHKTQRKYRILGRKSKMNHEQVKVFKNYILKQSRISIIT